VFLVETNPSDVIMCNLYCNNMAKVRIWKLRVCLQKPMFCFLLTGCSARSWIQRSGTQVAKQLGYSVSGVVVGAVQGTVTQGHNSLQFRGGHEGGLVYQLIHTL